MNELGELKKLEKRLVMGKQINVAHLSEKQLKVLDWGLSQKNLSMHDIDNQKLEDIIANLTVVYDYEQA